AAGGTILLVALCIAAGFCDIPGVTAGGVAGLAIATTLHAYLDFGGGYLVVILTIVGGLALMAGRPPTELAASIVTATIRSRESDEAPLDSEDGGAQPVPLAMADSSNNSAADSSDT